MPVLWSSQAVQSCSLSMDQEPKRQTDRQTETQTDRQAGRQARHKVGWNSKLLTESGRYPPMEETNTMLPFLHMGEEGPIT